MGLTTILVDEVTSCLTFSDLLACFRVDTSVWEDRLTLARLKEKVQSEDGRLVLRLEQEDWKVKKERSPQKRKRTAYMVASDLPRVPNSLCRPVLSSCIMSRSGRFTELASKGFLHSSPDLKTS